MEYNKYIDVILKTLFERSDIAEVQLYKEILKPNNLNIETKSAFKILTIMESLSLIKTPKQGFGHDVSVTIDKFGINLIYRFGSYSNYLRDERKKKIFGEFKYWFGVILTVLGVILTIVGVNLSKSSDKIDSDLESISNRLNIIEQKINNQDRIIEILNYETKISYDTTKTK